VGTSSRWSCVVYHVNIVGQILSHSDHIWHKSLEHVPGH
jgi:hypothetical protein